MTPTDSESLSKLASTATEWNALVDEAMELIRELDQFLRHLAPAVEVWGDALWVTGKERSHRGLMVEASYDLGLARDEAGQFGFVVLAETELTDEFGNALRDEEGMPKAYERAWLRRLCDTDPRVQIAAIPFLVDL